MVFFRRTGDTDQSKLRDCLRERHEARHELIMRIAAIYDIHSNLPALEAVLDEIRREKVDQIIVGGDVVPGPMPRETIARLLEVDLPTQFITGNGDREIVAKMRGIETGTVPERFRHV